MKKVLYLIVLLLVATGYAQNLQNANWYFGKYGGLTFLPNINNPLPLDKGVINTFEGSATVSNQTGALLFYTDGITVWNNLHNIMLNGTGLKGSLSSAQSAVIIPKPGSENHYYIITIDGVTGNKKGLYYSEVDMSTGNGQIILSSKNTVLKDHNGIDIDQNYLSYSEKLTSTIHSDGINYWVVTQIKNYVYSYLVSSNGISLTPVASPAPININAYNWVGQGNIKISPNTQRIGVAYTLYENPNPTGSIALGDFNYATGTVLFDSGLIQINGNYNFYGLEFSPDSNYLYFTTSNGLYNTEARSIPSEYTNIYVIEANKNHIIEPKLVSKTPVENRVETSLSTNTIIVTPNNLQGLQLSINGKIYATKVPGSNHLSVINNPNNHINPLYQDQTVLISGLNDYCLPQWVHWQNGNVCPAFIVLDTPETNASLNYIYSQYIQTEEDYNTSVNQDITMQAGDFVLLLPDTHIIAGSSYHAFIEDCSISTSNTARPGVESAEFPRIEYANLQFPKLTASPNPTSGMLQLSGITMKDVTVIDLSGKVVHQARIDNLSESAIDMSNLQQGMYFVKVTGTDETIHTVKVIKN